MHVHIQQAIPPSKQTVFNGAQHPPPPHLHHTQARLPTWPTPVISALPSSHQILTKSIVDIFHSSSKHAPWPTRRRAPRLRRPCRSLSSPNLTLTKSPPCVHPSTYTDGQTILHLFDPATSAQPALAKQLQQQLQDLQSRPEAWGLVAGLSRHDDANVRFFGAHTAQVKISRDW